MCGIVGFLNFDGAPADVHVLENMVAIQRLRGPDDHGIDDYCGGTWPRYCIQNKKMAA